MVAIHARHGFYVLMIVHVPREAVEIVKDVLAEATVVPVVGVKHLLMKALVKHGVERLLATLEHLTELRMHAFDVKQHVVFAFRAVIALAVRATEVAVQLRLDDAFGGREILGDSLGNFRRRLNRVGICSGIGGGCCSCGGRGSLALLFSLFGAQAFALLGGCCGDDRLGNGDGHVRIKILTGEDGLS